MTKAIINKQLVTVKVLKTRKLFWLFEQVLVEWTGEEHLSFRFTNNGTESVSRYTIESKWIPKSNLIEE